MQDRNGVINQIIDLIGSECDSELAERVYNELRSDGRIYYDDARGLVLRDDVDLIAVAADLANQG